MKKNEFWEKAFGKDKDEKTHAKAMLAIYGVFLLVIILAVRLNPNSQENNNKQEENKTGVVEPTPTPTASPDTKKEEIESDINYAYSYTITYDGVTEVYLGKRIDDKQKFSYSKDGKTLEYAIKDGEYLIKENDVYHITDKLDTYFRYCDIEKLLELIREKKATPDTYIFTVTNEEIARTFKESIPEPTLTNTIELIISNSELKGLKVDFSNYVKSVKSLIIKIEYADVGKVEDFDIKMN